MKGTNFKYSSTKTFLIFYVSTLNFFIAFFFFLLDLKHLYTGNDDWKYLELLHYSNQILMKTNNNLMCFFYKA